MIISLFISWRQKHTQTDVQFQRGDINTKSSLLWIQWTKREHFNMITHNDRMHCALYTPSALCFFFNYMKYNYDFAFSQTLHIDNFFSGFKRIYDTKCKQLLKCFLMVVGVCSLFFPLSLLAQCCIDEICKQQTCKTVLKFE